MLPNLNLATGGGAFAPDTSSRATAGATRLGGHTFGPVRFGSMQTGIDPRWLIGACVAVAFMFFLYLIWR